MINYCQVAKQAGIDPYKLLKQLDIDVVIFENSDDMRLPLAKANELLELTAIQAKDDEFGLRLALSRRLSDLGIVGLLIAHKENLSAILLALKQYRTFFNHTVLIDFEEGQDLMIIKEQLQFDYSRPKSQSYGLVLGILINIFKEILGAKWHPISAHFSYSRPRNIQLHRRIFGEHLEFNASFNGFTCVKDDLTKVNPLSDPLFVKYAEQLINANRTELTSDKSMSDEVRKSIAFLLPKGSATLTRIAKNFDINERTLQRRLKLEGNDFSKILNDIKRELAQQYLANDTVSLTHVAQRLGFSQPSGLTRWFQSEFKMPPSLWKNTGH